MIDLYSFKFGTAYLKNYGVHIASRDVPFLPNTRDKILDIPGRAGKLHLGTELAERLIELPCVLKSQSASEFTSTLRTLAMIFDPLKGPQKLILDEEPDKYWMAVYSGVVSIHQTLKWGEFTLPMMCYDPYAYSIMESSTGKTVSASPDTLDITRDVYALDVAPVIRIQNTGGTVVTGLKITRTKG